MAATEKLHELIHTNLELLRDGSYKIDFEEGMFRQPNLPKFEKVGHALLMILDPAECNKTIPWPLLEDKSLRSEFRNKFVKFIKMINSKYPQAQIPEIPASKLHFPVGQNFLQFMYKLSTFAVLLEVTRTSSLQEVEELLPKFQPSKLAKDNKVKLDIVRGACHAAKGSLQEVTDYQATARPLIQKLRSHNEEVCSKIMSVSVQLKNQIAGLSVDDLTKHKLMDIEDSDVMTDWNARTDQKVVQLRHQAGRLVRLRDLTAECRQRMAAASRNSEDLCLDGTKLVISPALAEMAGCPVYNSRGDVKLAAVLKAGQACAEKLDSGTPTMPPLLPEAQELLREYRELQVRAVNLNAAVETCCNESRRIISKLRPVVYSYIKQKPAPDHFKYLRTRPAFQFVRPCSPPRPVSTGKKEKPRRWSEIVKKKKSHKVSKVCSVKQRRSHTLSLFDTPATKGFRHLSLASTIKRGIRPPTTRSRLSTHLATLPRCPLVTATSTPAMPTCRKSLYGQLPSGPKVEEVEEVLPPLPDQSLAFNGVQETATSSLLQVTAATPRLKRRSIIDIVERFNEIKKKMEANNKISV